MTEEKNQPLLTREWLEAHGWIATNRIAMFQGDPECIDADLCVVANRKEYMIARFHYLGDKAMEPSAKPYSFEVVGMNNTIEMLEYDHQHLVLAAFVCNLTGYDFMDAAVGGKVAVTVKTDGLIPKFKVGDKICKKNEREFPYILNSITNGLYLCDIYDKDGDYDDDYRFSISEQDKWELVDKCQDFNNVKGCVTRHDGDQYEHTEKPDDVFAAFTKEYMAKYDDEIVCVYDRYAGLVDGIRWQRKQMLNDAVDGEVTHGKNLTIPSLAYFLDKNGLDYGDKVKVIIIKSIKL